MTKRVWLLVAAPLPLTLAALAQEHVHFAKAAQNPLAAMDDRIGERAK
jgi:hypothetical protein